MKHSIIAVFSFALLVFVAYLLPPPVNASNASCNDAGGRCQYVSGPSSCYGSGGTFDYSISCDQIRNRCCIRPTLDTCGNLARSLGYSGGACFGCIGEGQCLQQCPAPNRIIGSCDLGGYVDAGNVCCALASGGGGGGGGGGGAPPPAPRFNISGNVFIDSNRNGVRDIGESGDPGSVIVMSGRSSGSRTTNSSGNYAFNSFLVGTYTLTISIPIGFVNTTPVRQSFSIGPNKTDVNFGIVQVYYISGNVFSDINKNRIKDSTNGNPEVNISGITMSASGGTLTVNAAAGTYVVTDLLAGTYTVSYTSPFPPGYFIIYPRTGPPPELSFTVGPNCTDTIGLSFGASCNGGNVDNANFAISNSIPWTQSYGLDVRIDEGFDDVIPIAPLYPRYASVEDELNNATLVFVTQGILFSQDAGGPAKVIVNNLTPGKQYKIIVSGTYLYQRYTNDSRTDAQWDDWELAYNCYCRHINKVMFDGVELDAADYQTKSNPAHDYTYLWTPTTSQLEMYIPDGYYGDNEGWLTYKVYTNF